MPVRGFCFRHSRHLEPDSQVTLAAQRNLRHPVSWRLKTCHDRARATHFSLQGDGSGLTEKHGRPSFTSVLGEVRHGCKSGAFRLSALWCFNSFNLHLKSPQRLRRSQQAVGSTGNVIRLHTHHTKQHRTKTFLTKQHGHVTGLHHSHHLPDSWV